MGLSFAAPLAGRDYAVALGEQVVIISIHAPLAGRDGIAPVGPLVVVDFNPRTRDLIPLPSEKQPVGHLASRLFDHDGSHCIRDEGGKPTISLIQEKLYNEIARKRRLYVVMCSTVSQRKNENALARHGLHRLPEFAENRVAETQNRAKEFSEYEGNRNRAPDRRLGYNRSKVRKP